MSINLIIIEPKVLLRCIRESGKLRIRIETFIDIDRNQHHGVYNNNFNCQFPRDIRVEGRMYEVPQKDVHLVESNGRKPFYRVSKNNIKIIESDNNYVNSNVSNIDDSNIEVYDGDLTECAICFENPPNIVFVPCGHLQCCGICYEQLVKEECPICRTKILRIIIK